MCADKYKSLVTKQRKEKEETFAYPENGIGFVAETGNGTGMGFWNDVATVIATVVVTENAVGTDGPLQQEMDF